MNESSISSSIGGRRLALDMVDDDDVRIGGGGGCMWSARAPRTLSTLDFLQNMQVRRRVVSEDYSDDDVPSLTLSPLVERRPIAPILKHLEEATKLSMIQDHSLPSLTLPYAAGARRVKRESRHQAGSGEDGRRACQEIPKKHKVSATIQAATPTFPTPLYQAVSSGAPCHVIQSIVNADPASPSHQNGGGLTPLHCAIERYDTSVNVLLLLLDANPASAAKKCWRGYTPVDLLWKRYVEPDSYRSHDTKLRAAKLKQAMHAVAASEQVGESQQYRRRRHQVQASKALESNAELAEFWKLFTLFIRAACHGTTSMGNPSTNVLHEAVILGCDPLVIRFAAALYPEQLDRPDPISHRLPLHIAAASQGDTTTSKQLLRTLIALDPQASSRMDKDGRLPLHLAIEAGIGWEGGLDILIQAYPDSLTTLDPKTRLLPVMLASVSKMTDANVVYNLLCSSPMEPCRYALEGME